MALTAETRVCAVNGFVVHITWSGDEKARHGGRFRATDSSPGLCRPSRWVRGKAYLAICSPSVPVGRARGLRLVDYAWKPLVGHRPREAPFRARLPSLTVQSSAPPPCLPACLAQRCPTGRWRPVTPQGCTAVPPLIPFCFRSARFM